VAEAGIERLADRLPRVLGPVVGHRQVDRAGDRGGVPADLGAEAVQQGAAGDDVLDVAARDVPQVGMLGHHAQRRRRAPADHDRRVRTLDRLGVAERARELDVGAVEVERLGLGPQPPDHRARLGEALHGVGEVVEGQAVRLVLAPGDRMAGPRACADAEVEAAAGDDVDGRGDLGQHRGRPEAVAADEHTDPEPPGLRGERREQRPALVDRAVQVAEDRQEVVEQPGVLDLGDRVRLAPDAQDVLVVDLRLRGHDPEAGCGVRHGTVILSSGTLFR
jgi:hypothetical protein